MKPTKDQPVNRFGDLKSEAVKEWLSDGNRDETLHAFGNQKRCEKPIEFCFQLEVNKMISWS